MLSLPLRATRHAPLQPEQLIGEPRIVEQLDLVTVQQGQELGVNFRLRALLSELVERHGPPFGQ
jgi:hypothetical protein